MGRRRSASEIERAAAEGGAPPRARQPPPGEVIAMLLRRGLNPRVGRRDLPFPPELEGPPADAVVERLGHYAFRLFLRGAIRADGPFRPQDATRYVAAARARSMAEDLVTLGLAEPVDPARFRLRHPPRNFGGTLEWWVGRELRRLGFDVATGVRSGATGVGGDLDVVAAAEGKLIYVELKSSPPKHLTAREVAAFLGRVRSLRPHVTVFAVDTALRLSDKVLPLVRSALAGAEAPRRILRDTWLLAPSLYVTNARQDLIANLREAIADGFLALGPPPPQVIAARPPAPRSPRRRACRASRWR